MPSISFSLALEASAQPRGFLQLSPAVLTPTDCGAGYMHPAAFAGLWEDCSSKETRARHLPDPSHPSFGFATFFWCQEEINRPKHAHQQAVYLSETFRTKAGSWPQ